MLDAVGDLLRCVRIAFAADAEEEDLFSAVRIFCASVLPMGHFGFPDSSSEPDEPDAESAGVTSEEFICTMLRLLE